MPEHHVPTEPHNEPVHQPDGESERGTAFTAGHWYTYPGQTVQRPSDIHEPLENGQRRPRGRSARERIQRRVETAPARQRGTRRIEWLPPMRVGGAIH